MSKTLRAIWAVLAALVLTAPLSAHESRPAIAELYLENGSFRLEIRLNLEAIVAKIGPKTGNTDDSPNAAKYDELRAMGSQILIDNFSFEAFEANMVVLLDGEPGRAEIELVSVPVVGDVELLRDSHIVVTGALGGASALQLGWDRSYGDIIIRLIDEQNDFNAYLTPGAVTDPIPTEGAPVLSFGQNLLNYIYVGFDHIVGLEKVKGLEEIAPKWLDRILFVPLGLDHILVVGLFLLSPWLKPLMMQITTFTLAHSVTLALGILGVVTIPGWIVEPLIAASIVYVCVENIFLSHLSRWRPALIFGFGLLHGLGFAGALTEFGLSQNNLVSGLIGFNLGVELGQLTVILVCFLLVGFWFSGRAWYRRVVTIPASAVIALIGAYWVVERTLFA
jgi:hypothetical protein